MNKLILAIVAILALWLAGCEDETTRYIVEDNPPSTPQGVYSITGDESVFVIWLSVRDSDLDFYRVWRSLDDSVYKVIASTEDTTFLDTDLDNGTTYYYAVSAVDKAGQESALSFDQLVYDTPRSSGENLLLFDYHIDADRSGFDFSQQRISSSEDTIHTDIYVDYDSALETFFLTAGNRFTDIQDMGYTHDFDEIGFAPDSGWSAVGWCEIIKDHTYVIWTWDDHFAKMRVLDIYESFPLLAVVFDWAYQDAPANQELARPQHDDNYLGRTMGGAILK
jgi:hypothetical protein